MVDEELVTAETCATDFDPAVYVFEQSVTPNETDEPVAIGAVAQDSTEMYRYLIENLVADTYTAAFTCTGAVFVPADGKAAVIEIGVDTPLNFTVDDLPAP